MVRGEISTPEAGVGGEEVCCRHEGAAQVLGEGSGLQREAGLLTGDRPYGSSNARRSCWFHHLSNKHMRFGIRDCECSQARNLSSMASKEEEAMDAMEEGEGKLNQV